MPHKTKKHKIIADYRRKLQAISLSQQVIREKPISSVIQNKSPKREIHTSISPRREVQTITNHIRTDLRKTITLSVIAICIEFVLYFVAKS